MFSMRTKLLTATFFCTFGWVCNGQATEGTEQFTEGAAAPVAAPAPAAEPTPDDVIQAVSDAVSKGQVKAPADATPVADTTAPAAPAADAIDAGKKGVSVTNFDTVSLNVQNTDLANVLQLLSIQGKRNIVPSPKVSGTVTANLYDVTFHEALDAILQQNGAGYIEKGNFIFVYTFDELQKIKDAERKVAHRIFKLNYITAQDASTFITPLLSSAGSIAISGQVAAGFQPSTSDGGANSFSHAETMIVRDYPEHLEEVAKVVEQIDTKPEQVLVEATILKADLTEDLAFGVDLSILADMGLATGGVSNLANTVNSMIDGTIKSNPTGAVTTSVGNVSTGKSGVKVGILTHNVQVFVRALDQVTDTTILANPKIMTLNRQRAEVLVGEKVAYLSTTATATATTQTVEFLDTGTQLTLRPFVSSDGNIRLELKPSISSATLRDAGAGANVVTLPDETTQELTTNVMVPDGRTVVLGGLFKEETTISRNQVPGLGEIPLVGEAFRGHDNTVDRSEVIFLITPHIVKDSALAAAGEAASNGVQMARLGAREGLLPWSRSKMTAAHVRDALKYMESNDKDKALWEVDMALSMDPNLTEARRLKEKLTGQRAYWPGNNLLDDVVDVMVGDQTRRREIQGVKITPDPTPTLPPLGDAKAAAAADPATTPTASVDTDETSGD
ncbi:MAG: hypothetical protein GC162_02165 [Planctomycetes bacterium]|nr:hypothetical protein [Planctomycetota bacterium]